MKHKKEIRINDELNCYEFDLTKAGTGTIKIGYIDFEDYWILEDYNWYAYKDDKTFYINAFKKGKKIRLHQLLMGFPEAPLTPDHINQNGLDNRRCNLRIATKREQCRNQSTRSDNKSGIKGVYFKIDRNSWCARINNNEGIRESKWFSVNKYGFDEAKKKTIDWRKQKEIEYDYNL